MNVIGHGQSQLRSLILHSKCRYAFSQPRHHDGKLEPWVLESETGRLQEKLAHDKIRLDPGVGLHTLRHTFLTEAREHADVFTLEYIGKSAHKNAYDEIVGA